MEERNYDILKVETISYFSKSADSLKEPNRDVYAIVDWLSTQNIFIQHFISPNKTITYRIYIVDFEKQKAASAPHNAGWNVVEYSNLESFYIRVLNEIAENDLLNYLKIKLNG